jgi:hypothetical protein
MIIKRVGGNYRAVMLILFLLYSREKEEEELERLRLLPEEVRLKEDLERAEETRNKDKGEFTFMQKYYHKGAFYHVSQTCTSSIDDSTTLVFL